MRNLLVTRENHPYPLEFQVYDIAANILDLILQAPDLATIQAMNEKAREGIAGILSAHIKLAFNTRHLQIEADNPEKIVTPYQFIERD